MRRAQCILKPDRPTPPEPIMGARNRTRNRKREQQEGALVGLAWYRSDQWERLREVSEDRADLEETWEEWIRTAEKTLRDLQAKGVQAVKVDVDVEELVRWCQSKQQPVRGASRANFAAEKLRREDSA